MNVELTRYGKEVFGGAKMRNGILPLVVLSLVLISIISCGKKEKEEELFAQAQQYERKTELKKAIRFYEKLARKFPEGKHGTESLTKAAALNAEIKKFKKAIADYKKLINNYPQSDVVTKSWFMIGFIYANNLRDSTRAKEIYQRLTEDGVFAQAEELERKEDFRKAIQAYENVADFFPNGKRRGESLSKAAFLYANLKEFGKAIAIHQKIVQDCPESNLCRQSQFMIGFIYANDLKDYAKAREAYNLFLKKYPEDELVPSVKWELANLGKDINEIQFLSTKPEKQTKRQAKGGR